MKKYLFYIIFPFVALIAATPYLPQPRHQGMLLKHVCSHKTEVVPTTDSSLVRLGDELTYYFDRHNVQDEGYEMVTAFAEGKRLQVKTRSSLSAFSVGTWQNHQRQGLGVVLDSLRRTVLGTWLADTLMQGVRLDSLGTYRGDFNGLVAQGHGAYQLADGGYFEGHMENDLRHGFGLEMLLPKDGEARLRVGEWSKGRFWGERMKYTSERIYGIDIARYQHGKGRRKYPIIWKQLGINYLGRKTHKNVDGTADYPVSFIFIKSTEGTSIRNQYYANDYAQARKHGIPIGAYHFFSLKSSGAAQAQHFIKNTKFQRGDLPPVLDVEPSDAQIMAAGGPEKMFQQIRIWLKMVKSRCGVTPILYINQMFINKYFSLAPDIKRDYDVWIARYGEYKPDVRLAFWQLSSDGRVKGITGDVDINVFNGYKSQFETFLEEKSIK